VDTIKRLSIRGARAKLATIIKDKQPVFLAHRAEHSPIALLIPLEPHPRYEWDNKKRKERDARNRRVLYEAARRAQNDL